MKFSPALEAEIRYRLETKHDSYDPSDPEDSLATREDVLQELIQDSDIPDHYAASFKKELQNFQIEIGIVKASTKKQLENVTVTRGKKYDFKRGELYYRFESWEPLFKSTK